jgi:MoxR-like ATPase
MLKVVVDYPSHDEELTVVARSLGAPPTLQNVLSIEDLKALQREVMKVYVDPGLISWVVDVASATRNPDQYGVPDVAQYISYGASPRGPISVVAASRALALLRGRDYVLATDVEELVHDAFRHRLVLSYQALAEEVSADRVLNDVLARVQPPQLDLKREAAVA